MHELPLGGGMCERFRRCTIGGLRSGTSRGRAWVRVRQRATSHQCKPLLMRLVACGERRPEIVCAEAAFQATRAAVHSPRTQPRGPSREGFKAVLDFRLSACPAPRPANANACLFAAWTASLAGSCPWLPLKSCRSTVRMARIRGLDPFGCAVDLSVGVTGRRRSREQILYAEPPDV
ncbi:hypothetical protein FH972_021940 [Carpinus fangiana]|uniref:Uncharacterized protein n=1 Tax=Carpinus fangiana TaxID=176857 RepID=A0A5N6KSY9_9ROSI|nr:hypothetical protein FH972_021940 [Carpinus fangiana]